MAWPLEHFENGHVRFGKFIPQVLEEIVHNVRSSDEATSTFRSRFRNIELKSPQLRKKSMLFEFVFKITLTNINVYRLMLNCLNYVYVTGTKFLFLHILLKP